MIKLIVSDIDGTLVDDRKQLPRRFEEVTQLMQQHNVRFCVASGRQYQSLQNLFKHIPNEIAYVCDNGAYIRFEDKELFEKVLQYDEIKPLLEICDTISGIAVILCGKKRAYVKTDSSSLYREVLLHYPALDRISNFDKINDVIFKITVCDEKNSLIHTYPHLSHFNKHFEVVVSGENWIDVTHKNVNKGNAIQMLQKLWNITPEETVVFGDQLNDLEMMQSAHYSYAMKNAKEQVKQIANYITEYDNNNEGVLRKIEELLS